LQPENREEKSPRAPFQNKIKNRRINFPLAGQHASSLTDDAALPVQTPKLFLKVGEHQLREGCP